MSFHKIAGLLVDMEYRYERMLKQAAPYRCKETSAADMTIKLPDEFLAEKGAELGVDMNDSEYLCTGAAFNSGILRYGGFMLHSSAVAMDGAAYLFSADSGTGKSTHTGLWQKEFGAARAKILNDDKPVIRIGKSKIYACGTPWSGKNDISLCENVPIAGICFLERSAENWIKRVNGAEATAKLLKQTIRPNDKEGMNMLLHHVDKVLSEVPIYFMGCNISTEAARTAYEAMRVRTEKNE